MAHNLLGHGDHGNMRKLIDQYRSIDPSIEPESHTAIRPYSASADILADKLALKLLHQSGFSVASYISFWQRMGEAAEQGKADTYKALHPFAHERIQALPKLISAITRKTPLRKEAGVAVLAGQR